MGSAIHLSEICLDVLKIIQKNQILSPGAFRVGFSTGTLTFCVGTLHGTNKIWLRLRMGSEVLPLPFGRLMLAAKHGLHPPICVLGCCFLGGRIVRTLSYWSGT